MNFSIHLISLILVVAINFKSLAFKILTINNRIKYSLNSIPDWLTEDENKDDLSSDTITVRFINTISGKDVVVEGVKMGSNLLAIGDGAGVKLPRACRTGLCGSCTCEVQDPQAIKTSSNPRDGFATLRACSTKCFVPSGMNEMVVDVHRMKRKPAPPKTIGMDSNAINLEEISFDDPMARFSGDWEKEFRPQWEIAKVGAGQVGGASNPKSRQNPCQRCNGIGRSVCYACLGNGKVLTENNKAIQCATCVGMQTTGCGYCRGTGISLKKKT